MDSNDIAMVTPVADIAPAQVRAARALMGWSREKAARECGIGVNTLGRLETGVVVSTAATLETVVDAYNGHGIVFLGRDRYRGAAIATAPSPENSP